MKYLVFEDLNDYKERMETRFEELCNEAGFDKNLQKVRKVKLSDLEEVLAAAIAEMKEYNIDLYARFDGLSNNNEDNSEIDRNKYNFSELIKTIKNEINNIKKQNLLNSGYIPDMRSLMRLAEGLIENSNLSETPIEDLSYVGDWSKNSSFGTQERKILNNPKAVEKIMQKWSKTTVPFNIYLVNNPEGRKHTEVGEVSREWLDKNMPNTSGAVLIKPDAVNVLFTNNKGDQKVPFTAWIMAHRLGHVLSRYDFRAYGSGTRQLPEFTQARDLIMNMASTILDDAYQYDKIPGDEHRWERKSRDEQRQRLGQRFSSASMEKILVSFLENIGTMRSARMKEIRNEFEFTLELLAQYMLVGKIKFNLPPKSFKAGRTNFYMRYDTPEKWQQFLEMSASDLDDAFEQLLQAAVGRIFVM